MEQLGETLYGVSDSGAILRCYLKKDKSVCLPAMINGVPLKEIASGAFAGEASSDYMIKRKHVWEEIGNGVLTEEIIIPDTVEKIGEGAFARCQQLTVIHLPEGLTALSAYLFSDCRKLLPFCLPKNITEIGDYAFQNCRTLTTITLPEGLKYIGNYAFYNCRGLKELILPASILSLGTGALKNCEALTFIALAGHRNIQNVVADLHHAFTLSIEYKIESEIVSAYLYFPDEACEFIENYPARQFQQVNYGTGHLYRQCISNWDIDYQRYDQLFKVAKREEPFERLVTIAKYRLCYTYRLPNERKEEYEYFFKENLLPAMELLFAEDDMKTIETLANCGIFTAENIDSVIQLAANKRKTAFASFLMDFQHRNIKKTVKNFEL